ncbi:DUF3152 domain-containing protein [Streptomyces sp. KK5PA1]|uniref:DUF3152 domain-containing protein n=2 Tax=Actinacidiphila acididurans TaxID=2784346 RepID=A0ABS2TY04_9ACTN|nr:DUF3152 domain-containing protein [Actinacidiphila acididurans]
MAAPGTGRRRRDPGGPLARPLTGRVTGPEPFADPFAEPFPAPSVRPLPLADPYPDDPSDTGGFAAVRPAAGHPEHREHTAWGRPGGWTASGGRGRRSAPDPVESWAEDWAAYDTGPALRPPALGGPAGSAAGRVIPATAGGGALRAQGGVPRPRQEFLDAFDAPARSDVRPGQDDPAAGRTDPAGADITPDATNKKDKAGKAGKPARTSGGPEAAEAAPDGAKGGGKARALGGVAAAAVVTVLAVVAAGQLAEGEKKHSRPDGKDPATRSTPEGATGTATSAATGAVPRAAAPAVTATAAPGYDALMARQYPLDPRLSLSGAFVTVPGHQAAPGRGKVMRVRVDVERGLPLDPGLFADAVYKTLNDPRSWGHGGTMTFERVSTGPADIVITLASPGTTAKWCAKSGLDTVAENVSCDSASTPRTMINAYRWAQGAATYGPARMHAYRQMLINHEVGHRLGHGHVGCPAPGAPAPVMMQQTKFLSLDGGPTCRPNPWPFP